MAHDVLAEPGGPRRADLVVEVEPRAEDRRVPHAPGQLATRAAGRAAARQVPVGVEGEHGDRVVPTLARIGVPLALDVGQLLGREVGDVDGLEALLEGEPARALSDEHHVPRVLHDASRRGDRVHDPLEPRDAPGAVIGPVHDAGVELGIARGVRPSAEADRAVRAQVFHAADALLDSVERAAARLHRGQRNVVGLLAEGPRGDEHRSPGLGRGTGRGAGSEQGGEEDQGAHAGTLAGAHWDLSLDRFEMRLRPGPGL